MRFKGIKLTCECCGKEALPVLRVREVSNSDGVLELELTVRGAKPKILVRMEYEEARGERVCRSARPQ